MNATTYEKQFDDILEGRNNNNPYDSEEFITYVKLNKARIKRWTKTGKVLPSLVEKIKSIGTPLNWLLITEPWCGDAAHSHVFIRNLADLNPLITLTIQNRDAANSEIDKYLTNGGKAIPILVVRDADGKDLFVWGPRPKEAQALAISQKSDITLSTEDKKKQLQSWYNKDKGVAIQNELEILLEGLHR